MVLFMSRPGLYTLAVHDHCIALGFSSILGVAMHAHQLAVHVVSTRQHNIACSLLSFISFSAVLLLMAANSDPVIDSICLSCLGQHTTWGFPSVYVAIPTLAIGARQAIL